MPQPAPHLRACRRTRLHRALLRLRHLLPHDLLAQRSNPLRAHLLVEAHMPEHALHRLAAHARRRPLPLGRAPVRPAFHFSWLFLCTNGPGAPSRAGAASADAPAARAARPAGTRRAPRSARRSRACAGGTSGSAASRRGSCGFLGGGAAGARSARARRSRRRRAR